MAKISGIIRSFIGLEILALYPLFTAPAHADCTPPPAGLVSWWPGEANANDIVGGNNGTLQGGITFASGEVGQGFSFNASTSSSVRIPYAPSLITPAYTVETWINPTAQVSGGIGQTVIFGQPYGQAQLVVRTGTTGVLVAFQFGINQVTFYKVQSTNEIPIGQFTHIAGTWDGTTLRLYINGVLNAQNTPGATPVDTGCDFFIGGFNTPEAGSCQYVGQFFNGIIDEVSFYNRALSAGEVAAIYAAGTNGKCAPVPMPPAINPQPTNQTVIVGQSATFSVSASGTAPLSYQWQLGGTNILTATNATLVLTNIQFAQAGNYAVQITNSAGTALSSNAVLTVVAGMTNNGALVDVDFGDDGGGGVSSKTGYAAVGQTTNDFWNFYDRSISPGVWRTSGTLTNLMTAAGVTTTVGMSVSDAQGAWHNGSSDPMYNLYIYPLDHGNNVVTFTNLPAGQYDVLAYSQDGNYEITVGGTSYGVKTTADASPGGVPVWTEGRQYARWRNVTVGAGQPLALTVRNGVSGYAILSGVQILGSASAATPPVVTSQPTNQTVLAGATATFRVSASGTAPLSYQWQLGGTNILTATNSLLTLTNVQLSQAGNYSVQISNILGSTNSATAVLTVVLPPVITTQPQSQSVLSFQSAGFTVAAAGTGPLSYQWRKNGTNLTDGGNISGSLTTNLNLAAVTLADAGNYDVVVSSPYAGTNSAVAVLTVPQTALTIGSASAMSGSTLTVPITMNALGVENTFLASVGYDTSKLVLQSVQLGQGTAGAYLQEVDTQTNNGLVGFAISLNTGEVIPAGTQQVAQLVFYTLPVTNNVNTSLTFGNNPTTRQILDNAFDVLPATYLGGTISLSPAEYEADVYPRPTGDHQVAVQDWLEVGRMVAGLDAVTNSDEMLRADCAPRNAPDGILTVADWVQAGRYALGLDPLTLVPPPVVSNLRVTAHGSPAPTRTVQLGTVSAQRGQTVSVPVLLISSTNENAVGLSVNYNPSQLKYLSATLGSALSGGRLNINTNLGAGKLGLALALSPGAALAAGTNQIAVLQFQTTTNAVGNVPLTLNSSVVQLQVVDKTALVLTANYVNGAVVLPLSPTVQAVKTGNNLQLAWPISAGSYIVQSASSLAGPWSNAPITIITNGANATITMQATNQQQFFRLLGQ
jgi:hypothetical protein